MKELFKSNGKLLITGEYVVLDGATALAVPTQYGQTLQIKQTATKTLYWKSVDKNGLVWFKDTFSLNNFEPQNTQNKVSNTLANILRAARDLNNNFLLNTNGLEVETVLDFPRNWGLGTSSTLINNIAQWAKVDAFRLLNNSFGGSGYDVAAAQSNCPILYTLQSEKPEIKQVSLRWNFTENLFFIHLNEKQDSKEGISHYRKNTVAKSAISEISELSFALLKTTSLIEFQNIISEHEKLISTIINTPTIKSRLFNDYPHAIKSLGAWGGDFIMVTGAENDLEYFKNRGYNTIIPFNEMLKF
ncbi:MAG: GHMP kinase [Aequorivita sp.]|nr:GHMP kinase [Aequorivita sp.]